MSPPQQIITGGCDQCQTRWSWLGRRNEWFVADKHGRSSLRAGEVSDDGQPKPLAVCPQCSAKLKNEGEAR